MHYAPRGLLSFYGFFVFGPTEESRSDIDAKSNRRFYGFWFEMHSSNGCRLTGRE